MEEYHAMAFYIGHHDARKKYSISEEVLHHAEDLGYDTLTTRITNDSYQPRVLFYFSEHNKKCESTGDVSQTIPQQPPIVLPSLSADDTDLSPSDIAPRLLHMTSTWIDLASPDPLIAHLSSQVLDQEITYAAFCGAGNVLIQGPSPRSSEAGSTQYARAVKRALQLGPGMHVQILLPMTYGSAAEQNSDFADLSHFARQEYTGDENAKPSMNSDPLGSWDVWQLIRSICNYDTRLSIALVIPRQLPSMTTQMRWYSEPLRLLNIPQSTFTPNKFSVDVLSKAHQSLISRYLRLKSVPWLLLSDVGPLPGMEDATSAITNGNAFAGAAYSNGTIPEQGSLSPLSMNPTPAEASQYPVHPSQKPTAHLQYLRMHLQSKQPPLTPLERYGAGYQDFPQSPLQPLTDNLESVTYEVFEKDPVKYAQYEAAIAAALRDWSKQNKPRSAPGERVVIAVVGAGRGPLVERALRAGKTSGVAVDVWAIEKNPSAFVHLQRRNRNEWDSRVHLLQSDMRTWKGPSYINSQSSQYNADTSQPSIPATFESTETHTHVDIMVSELLGSFADNELSPECLDGVQHLLNPTHGISIPTSYSAHLTPIAAPKLWSDIVVRPCTPSGADATQIPYVAWLHAIDYLSPSLEPSLTNSSTSQPLAPDGRPQHAQSLNPPDPIVKQAWSFTHPLPASHIHPSNSHNARFTHLTFATPHRGVCHGLAGYFECVLYTPSSPSSNIPPPESPWYTHPHTTAGASPAGTSSLQTKPNGTHVFGSHSTGTNTTARPKPIEISTHPLTMPTKSADMISWFPIFFPLKTPLYVPDNGEISVSMWRMTDGRKVWYEWLVDVWAVTGGGEEKGRRCKVGSSGLISSEKEGCLM